MQNNGQKPDKQLRDELYSALKDQPFDEPNRTVKITDELEKNGWGVPAIDSVIAKLDTLVKPVTVSMGTGSKQTTAVEIGFRDSFDELLPLLQ